MKIRVDPKLMQDVANLASDEEWEEMGEELFGEPAATQLPKAANVDPKRRNTKDK